MEQYIALSVKQADADKALARQWYQTVMENLPNGLTCTVARGDEQIRMMGKTADGKVGYTIPLIRHLTEKEVSRVIEAFDNVFNADYVISSSKIEIGYKKEIAVELPYSPLLELCTKWAKQQHEEWMKDKLDAGWRYGPSVSMTGKTHPLLRQWNDLPDAYREVNTTKAEELVKLFNDNGYLMIHRDDLKTGTESPEA